MDGMPLPSSPMQSLQAEHERLLGRLDETGGAPCPGTVPVSGDTLPFDVQALINEARAYIERSQIESEWIFEARDRSQLRANLRFWGSFILNCTGTYPDTTLRPARTYRPEISMVPVMSQADMTAADNTDRTPVHIPGVMDDDGEFSEQEEDPDEADSDASVEMLPARHAWFSKLSRVFGLLAILVVGVIPLAAVCLALSLIYSLDNRSPLVWPRNFATQTANVASLMPSATPELPSDKNPGQKSGLPVSSGRNEFPLMLAQVTIEDPPPDESGCTPVLILTLDAPVAIDGAPTPAGNVMVSLAGTDHAVANGILEPGMAPLSLGLEKVDLAQKHLDWLVQVEHPWLDLEAVILSRSALDDCAGNQVSIEYRSEAVPETWHVARDESASGDLSLTWRLLTWGPDALEGQDWVSAIQLQASGGNGNYVYFAEGDLGFPTSAGPVSGLLSGDQVVLGQKSCVSGIAHVGVTSAGQILRRMLAVQLVMPECR
jgi:hypothetical protein